MPPEWHWEADKVRGGDLVLDDGTNVHVRSSRTGDDFLWRDNKDSTDGIWLFADTSKFPVVTFAGQLTGAQAHLAGASGRIRRECLLAFDSCRRLNG